MKRTSELSAILVALALSQPLAAADFTVTVEPSFPAEQAVEVYRPLVEYLERATGHRFELVAPNNYHGLWRSMHDAAGVDFAFEEAPFTGYRSRVQGFVPLARTIEPTRFTLIAEPEAAEAGVSGLIGYRVASMPAPSMGYVLLSQMFPNPVSQPEILSAATSWRDGVEMVFAGEAEAAIVPDYIAGLYPNLVPLGQSAEFPGRAFSAAASVPAEVREAVTTALLGLAEDAEMYELLAELGISGFQATASGEYAGSDSLLRRTFGYVAD